MRLFLYLIIICLFSACIEPNDPISEENIVDLVIYQDTYGEALDIDLTDEKMVVAANYQQKGFELHHAILSISGSLTQEKLSQAIKESGVNSIKHKIHSSKDETEKIIILSSFLAGGIGARGTPSIFVNEIFTPGYISKQQIINMLK